MSGALRVLFAELGFSFDAAAIAKADAAVQKLALDLRHLAPAAAAGAAAVGKTGKATTTFHPFGAEAQKGRATFGEGSGLAKWKAEAKAAGDATKPITGLIDLIAKFETNASAAIGQKLPAAFKRLAEKMGVARGDFGAMGRLATAATGAVVGGLLLAVRSAFGFVAEFTTASEALRETARAARVTSSELQALQHAGAISGVGADRMTASVTALGQRLRDASSHLAGGSGVVHTLRRMGIAARDASGQVRPTVDILDDVAVAMEHVSSPRRRIRIAESLGLDRRMLDVLHTGAGGIRALREEMTALGGGVTPEATEAARRFAMAQARVAVGLTSVRSVIFTSLAPSLEELTTRGAQVLGWLARMTRGSHMVRNMLVALGIAGAAAALPLIVAWAPAAAPFVLAAAGALLLALALDDVQAFLEGNNSLLGEFIDDLAGLGTAERIVRGLRDAWQTVEDVLDRIVEQLARIPGLDRLITSVGTRAEGVGGSGATPGAPVAAGPVGPRLGFDGLPIVAPGRRAVATSREVPSTRTVAGGVGRTGATITTHRAGDRHVFNLSGADPVAMHREVARMLADRERRDAERRDGQHPTEDTE